MSESVDRRILGAFVCIDAMTGNSIPGPLLASNPLWRLKPNQSGIFVIFDGPGFNEQTGQFVPAGTWPAAVSFEITIQDPQGRYLPRRATIKAPLAVPAVTAANISTVTSDPTTVFDPQPVKLYPTAAAAVSPNWAVIRVSVVRTTPPSNGLQGAYVRADSVPAGAKPLAEGVTGPNGETILVVRGLTTQVSGSAAGPLTVSTTPVNVTAWFDPSNLNPPAGRILDPQTLIDKIAGGTLATNSVAGSIGAGTRLNLNITIAV
jgi:hypothetical protein